jgi:uncharacterized protein
VIGALEIVLTAMATRTRSAGTSRVPPALGLLLVLAAGCAPAITGDEQTLPFESEITGSAYDILVRTPPGYDEDRADGYALVLQLDATMATKALTQYRYTAGWTSSYEESGDVPEAIVVGIGHTEAGMGVGRSVDFVPPSDLEEPLFPDPGAPAFHQMLRDELLPWLEADWNLSADPADRVLLGHSLGGLFVLYAVSQYGAGGNDFLGNFVAFDPSVQIEGGTIFGHEQEASTRLDDLPVDLHVAVGGATSGAFVAQAVAFTDRLEERGYPGLRIRSEVLEGRDHMEIIPTMPELGLPWVFEQ